MGLETMTTFTSEDREWAYWDNYVCPKYSQQTEIKFFWPLTEQLELNLDYGPTQLYFRAKGIAGVHSLPIRGSIHEFKPTTWDGVGAIILKATELTIETPNMPWYRKLAFKLLGFKWK
jgi:hypothetical protein